MSQSPMDALNKETIRVDLNGEEAVVLIKALAIYATMPAPDGDIRCIMSLMDKLGPGIEKQAAKQMRLMRSSLN